MTKHVVQGQQLKKGFVLKRFYNVSIIVVPWLNMYICLVLKVIISLRNKDIVCPYFITFQIA